MSQSTDATEVDSQANAWNFPDELLGNSMNSLGSGYYIQYQNFPTATV